MKIGHGITKKLLFLCRQAARVVHPYLLMALCLVIIPLKATGQKLVPEVQINVDKMPQEAQTKLQNLQQKLQEYLERKQWVDDDYRYDLKVRINIYFTEYSPGPPEDKYKASITVANLNDANAYFEDRRWEFSLRQGYQFQESEYNPLTSVIEFYIWIVYGMEFDKLEKLGGRPYYDKARYIILESNRSPLFYGWDKRNERLEQMVSTENTIAREMSFFWDTGMYFYNKKDYWTTKGYFYHVLVRLEKLPAEEQSRFLEANYQKLGEALVRVEYSAAIDTVLKVIDPGRAAAYDRILTEGGKQ
jgi:hypothetical protein